MTAPRDHILRLHHQGWPSVDIAGELGLSGGTIAYHLRKAGLTPRGKKRGPARHQHTTHVRTVDAMMRRAMGDLGYPDIGETPEEAGERARQRRRRQAMNRFKEAG